MLHGSRLSTCARRAGVSVMRAPPTAMKRTALRTVCMAHPRRVAKVASAIQREVSSMFIKDPVMQSAICPDRVYGADELSAVATVTNVYVSNDLQVVKIYVSVYSDELGRKRCITNLTKVAPYVRGRLGATVNLRLAPEIRFEYDDSIEEMELVEQVIGVDEIKRIEAEIAKDRGIIMVSDEDDQEDEEGKAKKERKLKMMEDAEYFKRAPVRDYRHQGPFDDLFRDPPNEDEEKEDGRSWGGA